MQRFRRKGLNDRDVRVAEGQRPLLTATRLTLEQILPFTRHTAHEFSSPDARGVLFPCAEDCHNLTISTSSCGDAGLLSMAVEQEYIAARVGSCEITAIEKVLCISIVTLVVTL